MEEDAGSAAKGCRRLKGALSRAGERRRPTSHAATPGGDGGLPASRGRLSVECEAVALLCGERPFMVCGAGWHNQPMKSNLVYARERGRRRLSQGEEDSVGPLLAAALPCL